MLLCDLNCDLGEGLNNEQEIMPFITSANIACGFHAGDTETMKRVIDLCLEHGVKLGAHPSYPDRENFGRKDLVPEQLTPQDVYPIVGEQIGTLRQIAAQMGAQLHHVKPHGALYNRAAWNDAVGHFLCQAIKDTDPGLRLYGLSGSNLNAVASGLGIAFTHEVFADRTYQDDGSLTPRTSAHALIETAGEAIQQVLHLVQQQQVKTVLGNWIAIKAETICIHGDGSHAIEFARKINRCLKKS